jgi:hypothetical protein
LPAVEGSVEPVPDNLHACRQQVAYSTTVGRVHEDHATIEVLLLGLDGPERSRSLVEELKSLRGRGLLKVIDLVVVRKGADGSIASSGHSELSETEASEMREFITDALGFHAGSGASSAHLRRRGLAVLIGAKDVRMIADMLRPRQAALVIVVEHLWASRLGRLMRGKGITLLEDYMLSPGVLSGGGPGMGTW